MHLAPLSRSWWDNSVAVYLGSTSRRFLLPIEPQKLWAACRYHSVKILLARLRCPSYIEILILSQSLRLTVVHWQRYTSCSWCHRKRLLHVFSVIRKRDVLENAVGRRTVIVRKFSVASPKQKIEDIIFWDLHIRITTLNNHFNFSISNDFAPSEISDKKFVRWMLQCLRNDLSCKKTLGIELPNSQRHAFTLYLRDIRALKSMI